MFSLIITVIPEWLAKLRSPMDVGERHGWERISRRGKPFFILLWAGVMGGTIFTLGLCCIRFVDHATLNPLTAALEALGCFLAAVLVAMVDWELNESRFRLSEHSVRSL